MHQEAGLCAWSSQSPEMKLRKLFFNLLGVLHIRFLYLSFFLDVFVCENQCASECISVLRLSVTECPPCLFIIASCLQLTHILTYSNVS